MSIKEGETFEVGSNFKRQKTTETESFESGGGWGGSGTGSGDAPASDTGERMFQEHIILEREGAIDEITIHYADIASLQMLGIVNLDNYYHLSMIPPSLLTDATYVIKVFKTIIETKKSKSGIFTCFWEFVSDCV